MAEILHPFLQDTLNSGGRASFADAQRYARSQYDAALSDMMAAGQWTQEEAEQHTAAFINTKYGFNFADTPEQQEARMAWLNSLSMPSMRDQHKATDAIQKDAAKASLDEDKEFEREARTEAQKLNSSAQKQGALSKNEDALLSSLGFNFDEMRQIGIRAKEYMAPVDSDSVRAQVSRGLSMGVGDSAGYKAAVIAFADDEYRQDAKARMAQQQQDGPLGVAGNVAYAVSRTLGDLPVMLPGAAVGGGAGAITGASVGGPVGAAIGAAAGAGGMGFAAVESVNSTWDLLDQTVVPRDYTGNDAVNQAIYGANRAAQGFLIGAAAGAAGRGAAMGIGADAGRVAAKQALTMGANDRAAAVMGALANQGVQIPVEAAAFVGTGAAINGHYPTTEEFWSASAFIGGMRIAGFYNGKMHKWYRDNGFQPKSVLAIAAKSKEIAAKIRSTNLQGLQKQYGEHQAIWVLRRNSPDSQAAPGPSYPNTPQGKRMQLRDTLRNRREFMAERLGLTYENYKAWAQATAEQVATGVVNDGLRPSGLFLDTEGRATTSLESAGKRDAFGRPDPMGRVDMELPDYNKWLKGQMRLFEIFSQATEDMKANRTEAGEVGVSPETLRRMKRESPHLEIADPEQARIIQGMGERFNSASQAWFNMTQGSLSLGAARDLPTVNQMIQGEWGDVAQNASVETARRLNEANKVDDPAAPTAYAPHEVIVSNQSSVQFVNGVKEKRALADLFFQYADSLRAEGEPSFRSLFGATAKSQTEALFRDMPQRFQQWLRNGHGVGDKSKAGLAIQGIITARTARDSAIAELRKSVKAVRAKMATPEQVMEKTYGKERIKAQERKAEKAEANAKALREKEKETPEAKAKKQEVRKALSALTQEELAIRQRLDDGQQSRAHREKDEDRLIEIGSLRKRYTQVATELQRQSAPRYTEEIAQYEAEAKAANDQLAHWRQQSDKYSKARYAEEYKQLADLERRIVAEQNKFAHAERQGRKNIEDMKRKYLAPDIYTPATEVQMLNVDGKFFILDPSIVREKPAVDMSLQNVYEAASNIGKNISVDEAAKVRNAQMTYDALVDRVSQLNADAPSGQDTVPYLAARTYAGAESIAKVFLEDGPVIFEPMRADSAAAGMNPQTSGGLSLRTIRGHIDEAWAGLKGEVRDAITKVAEQVGRNTSESVKQDLALLGGSLSGKKGRSAEEFDAWYKDLVEKSRSAEESEATYWSGSKDKDALYMFRVFATAKHAQELEANGVAHGFDGVSVKAVADSPILNKIYGKVLTELRDFQYALLDYQVGAGLISKERALQIKGQYKYYVPFEKVQVQVADKVPWWQPWKRMSHEETVPTGEQAPTTNGNIIDPIEAVARNTFGAIKAAEKNQVIRVTAELYGTRARVEGEDLTLGDLFDWQEQRAVGANLEAKRTIEYFENGKAVRVQVNDEVANAIESMSTATANVYSNVLHRTGAAISGLLRLGSTLRPTFFISNLQRDFTEAFIQSESGFNLVSSVADGLKASFSRKTNNAMFPGFAEHYKEFQLGGGEYSTVVARDRKPLQDVLRSLGEARPWRDITTPEQKARLETAMIVARRQWERDKRTDFKRYREELQETLPNATRAQLDAIFENTKPGGPEFYLSAEMARTLQATQKPYNSVPLSKYGLDSLIHMLNPRNIIGTLQEFASVSEDGTRVGEFIASRRMGRSIKESGLRAREATIDFGRMGSAIQGLNSLVTFLNANIQGTDRFIRAMKNNPISTMSKVVSGLVIPGLTFALYREEYMANAAPDDELAAYMRRIPDYVYQTNFVIPDPINKTAWLVKKPFEYGAINLNPLESFVRFAYKRDPGLTWMQNMIDDGTIGTAREQFWLSGNKWINAFSLQPVDPVIDLRANYNSFTGQPIIPASQLSEVPYVMYGKNTPEIYKAMSYQTSQVLDKVGLTQFTDPKFVSPIGMQYLVENYTAGWGRGLVRAASSGLGKMGVLPDESKPIKSTQDIPFLNAFQAQNPGYNTQSVRKMFDALDRMERNNAAAKRLFRDGSEFSLKAAEGLVYAKTPFIARTKKAMATAINYIKFVERRTDIDDAEKYAEIEKHTKALIAMSEKGLEQIKQIEEQAKEYWVREVQKERQRRGYVNSGE